MLELDNSPERYYFPRKWCPIRRQSRPTIQSDTDSSSVSGDEEAEATSDDESLVVMRKKQAQVMRNMEIRVHELIEAHYRRYPGAVVNTRLISALFSSYT
jgi:hypothetical protein